MYDTIPLTLKCKKSGVCQVHTIHKTEIISILGFTFRCSNFIDLKKTRIKKQLNLLRLFLKLKNLKYFYNFKKDISYDKNYSFNLVNYAIFGIL